jgi:putative transposase
MEQVYPTEWPQFFTATVYKWQYLLDNDKHKTIITESLRFLVKEKRIVLYAFVVMSNHIHVIWQPMPPFSIKAIQASFMRHTGRQLRAALLSGEVYVADSFKANKADREYQIWKREPLSVELFSGDVFAQKLEYLHQNPVKAGLCQYAEDYFFSSAKFYYDVTSDFDMLTHFAGTGG